MKRQTQLRVILVMVLILLLVASISLAQGGESASGPERAPNEGVGTTFSYQGQLLDSDAPANDYFDFEFKLFDQFLTGDQVGAPVSKEDVLVSDGLFTVELDFGSGIFTGEARWLEIGVRPGSETGTYQTLSPRQRVRAAPYAISADLLDGEEASAFADANHNHWGASWSGANPGLTLTGNSLTDTMQLYNNGDGAALRAQSASGNAVYADGDVTITGDLIVLGAADLPGYANVVIVAKDGGDFTSIQAALDSIDDASAVNPYLVWVAPGIYYEQVIMEPYVDIRGAGELVTQISYTGNVDPYSGTVVGADNAELSYLTVINTGGTGATHSAVAIFNDMTSPRLSHLRASASGTINNFGIYNYAAASPTIQHVTASATGGSNSYGLYNDNASPYLNDVTLSASGAATNIGLSNSGSDTVLTNVRTSGTGGTLNYGIYNSASLTLTNVQIEGSGGSSNYGVMNEAASGSYNVTIDQAVIVGSTYTINNDSEFTTRVGASRLDGGAVSGTVTCAGVYDGAYAFYPDSCP